MSSEAAGSGGFSTSVTVYSYVGGGLYPVTGTHESGGTTAPTIVMSLTTYAYDPKVLTSPYAEEPPPGY